MGCGSSRRPFAAGWTKDPLSSPHEILERQQQWDARQAALRTRLGERDRSEEHLVTLPAVDEPTVPEVRTGKEYRSAFAWAPASSEGPTTVAGIWLSDSEPTRAHGSQQLALGWEVHATSANCSALCSTTAEAEGPEPADSKEQIWTENTPGRLRFWSGTEYGTRWTDLGDKLAPTESLDEFKHRRDQETMADLAAIDSAIAALRTTVADLEVKIPALERERRQQKAARNFREVGQLRKEIAGATPPRAATRAELAAHKSAMANGEAKREARIKRPVETRIVARFRSPPKET